MMTSQSPEKMKGVLLLDEVMEKHTSWRAGGPVDKFYTPANIDDLVNFMSSLTDNEPVIFLGLGSNLLVRDKGYRGTVISLKGSLSDIEVLTGNKLRVGAGTSCAKLARYCHRNNLIGGEFFAGIPGLVGGALAMNAGAFDGETWPLVESVMTINQQGIINQRTSQDYEIYYRSVTGHYDEWFVSVDFQFEPGNGEEAAERVKALLKKRSDTQPTGLPSCGSVFKNPQGDYAARLIEASGLKGFSIGGAVVSEKHANFIINSGKAKSSEIEALIYHVQKTVKELHDVDLETEVRIIGEINP